MAYKPNTTKRTGWRNGVGSRSYAPGNHRFSVGMSRVVSMPFRWDPLFLTSSWHALSPSSPALTPPHPAPPFRPPAQQRRSATARRSSPRRCSGARDGRLRPLLPHADTQSGPSSYATVYVDGCLCSVGSFVVCSVQLQISSLQSKDPTCCVG